MVYKNTLQKQHFYKKTWFYVKKKYKVYVYNVIFYMKTRKQTLIFVLCMIIVWLSNNTNIFSSEVSDLQDKCNICHRTSIAKPLGYTVESIMNDVNENWCKFKDYLEQKCK